MSGYKLKDMKYSELDGLSERQLKEHHDVLYAGYVDKANEIEGKLAEAAWDNPNATYSELRALLSELSFAINGIKLHEAYFDNMGGSGQPGPAVSEFLAANFGSTENFLTRLKAAAICARGWVVLAVDLDDGNARIITCDAHNLGGIWNALPILVLDVYEHAYFLDHGTARAKYVEAFIANIDWSVVENRLSETQRSLES